MANNSFGAIPSLSIHGSGLTLNQGPSNISIGNTNPFASITISDHWDNPNVKKYEVIETTEDLLALSAAWYRIRNSRTESNPGTVFPEKLLDKILFKEVNSDDRTKAADIRDYYSKKIMYSKLKGEQLTRFREDLNKFVHSDGLTFQESTIPLAYRLPEFYDYDVEFDMMMANHTTQLQRTHKNDTRTLNLVKTFNVGKRYSKRKEYWFSDDQNQLVCLTFLADNPLLSLLDNYTQDPIIVKGQYSTKSRNGKDFFVVNKHKFI